MKWEDFIGGGSLNFKLLICHWIVTPMTALHTVVIPWLYLSSKVVIVHSGQCMWPGFEFWSRQEPWLILLLQAFSFFMIALNAFEYCLQSVKWRKNGVWNAWNQLPWNIEGANPSIYLCALSRCSNNCLWWYICKHVTFSCFTFPSSCTRCNVCKSF